MISFLPLLNSPPAQPVVSCASLRRRTVIYMEVLILHFSNLHPNSCHFAQEPISLNQSETQIVEDLRYHCIVCAASLDGKSHVSPDKSPPLSRNILELDRLVTTLPVLVLMIPTSIPLGRVIEQAPSSPILDRIDHIDREIWTLGKTFSVTRCILLTPGIHDLPCRNLTHEFAKGAGRRCLSVDRFHFLGAGNEACFVASSAELVDGLIFQLLESDRVAKQVELLARKGVFPLDVLGHP